MKPSNEKFTEQDLKNFTKEYGKPLPPGFEAKVFDKIKKREKTRGRLSQLENTVRKNPNPENELEKD